MKKEMKKGISMIFSLAMILTMSVGYQGKKVKAATNTGNSSSMIFMLVRL